MDNGINIRSLLKSLIGTAGIFVLGMIFSFTFNWSITKFMHQEEVGFFQYYISIITFAMVIVPLGYQSLAQREVVSLGKKGLKRLINQAIFAITICSLIFGVTWYFGVTQLNWVKNLKDFSGLHIALLIIPIYSLNVFFRAVLQSQNKIYSSVLPDTLIRPIILLITLYALSYLKILPTPTHLLWTLFFIMLGALIFFIIKSFQKLPPKEDKTQPNWLKQAIILLPLGLVATLNERIDVIMISKYLGGHENALYSTAFKFALFSGFGLVILNQIMVPHYAKHFKSDNDKSNLERIIKPNVRLSFALSFTVFLCLVFISPYLLDFFGQEGESYELSYTPIIILAIGQLINVAVGSTGYILTMAKKEKLVMISVVLGCLSNLILNILLLPKYGITGAAIATSTSMIVWNVLMLIFVKRETGINPTIF